MTSIRPVSDLRNKFAEISDIVHEQSQPVFLTKNGSGDMVVMSLEYYDKILAKNEIYNKLAQARQEIENGDKGIEAKQFLRNLLDAE